MTGPDLMALAEQERAELLALARELTPMQWSASSLCSGWTVRDVIVHVVSYDGLSIPATVALFLRGGLRPGVVNEVALARFAACAGDEVVALLSRHQRPSGLPAGFGGGIALTDGTIHQQDIRRALGLPREIPAHRLAPVLDFSLRAPTLPSRRNVRGLRLVATDLGWSTGTGPDVVGRGEALLMAAAGRAQALGDLSGEGVATLERRVRRNGKPR